VEWE